MWQNYNWHKGCIDEQNIKPVYTKCDSQDNETIL